MEKITVFWCDNCNFIINVDDIGMKPICPDCNNSLLYLHGTIDEIEKRTNTKEKIKGNI